jgi:hypothetical protein
MEMNGNERGRQLRRPLNSQVGAESYEVTYITTAMTIPAITATATHNHTSFELV